MLERKALTHFHGRILLTKHFIHAELINPVQGLTTTSADVWAWTGHMFDFSRLTVNGRRLPEMSLAFIEPESRLRPLRIPVSPDTWSRPMI